MFLGLSQLLNPLLYHTLSSEDKYPSSVNEILKVLEVSSKPSVHREVPSPGHIFNLPILSQLGILLPRYLVDYGISVDLTVKNDEMDLGKLEKHIIEKPPIVLLVSGSNQGQKVIYGLFYPKGSIDEEAEPCIFQLEPVHRVFRTEYLYRHGLSIQVHPNDDKKPTLETSIIWGKMPQSSAMIDRLGAGNNIMSLAVSEEGFGHFTVNRDSFSRIEERFSVDAIELLKCDHQKINVEESD